MKRILVFCKRDWMHPRAGAAEDYVFRVFRHVVESGNHVAWMAHRALPFTAAAKRPRIETREGIQVARLGMAAFYPTMVQLFLDRMLKANNGEMPYDILVDCVTHYPLCISEQVDLPVIPLVFKVPRKLVAREDASTPLIAANSETHDALCEAGFPPGAIVRAPFGQDQESWRATANKVLATLENLA